MSWEMWELAHCFDQVIPTHSYLILDFLKFFTAVPRFNWKFFALIKEKVLIHCSIVWLACSVPEGLKAIIK